mgnify:CR=1 FL=1
MAMDRATLLNKIIPEWAKKLNVPSGINPVALLKALARQESTYGANAKPRREKGYLPGGKYFNADQATRYAKYGKDAGSSWGSFQILYPTAVELGFTGVPLQLGDDRVGIGFVMELLNRRILKRDKAQTIEQIADGYNSGTHRDKSIPNQYITELRGHYDYYNRAT